MVPLRAYRCMNDVFLVRKACRHVRRPQKALAVFPGWLGPSALGGVCFQEDYQLLAEEAALGQALRGTVYRRAPARSSVSATNSQPHELLERHSAGRGAAQRQRTGSGLLLSRLAVQAIQSRRSLKPACPRTACFGLSIRAPFLRWGHHLIPGTHAQVCWL